jgi:citrate lyase subunit beta/citryl-CoA lyase
MHPRLALFESNERPASLPVCDHYAGVEVRMRKSMALQAELGPVFDVTLDCEDGAPVGGEAEHADMIASFVDSADNHFNRIGARVHPVSHPSFERDLQTLVGKAGGRLAYVMVPKLQSLNEAQAACDWIDRVSTEYGVSRKIPIHGLIETFGGLRDVMQIAALPRIESLSFGLMDFVSAHRGAIPASGMSVEGQFSHPLVVRAKLEIAAACHSHGKTPSHCVVTEFKDLRALERAAARAARELGYTRMWSIHPSQIRPIVEAFAPSAAEVDAAAEILLAARAASWAPTAHRGTLHDRASYRYFWHVLERAHRTGQPLASQIREAFFQAPSA